MPDLVYPLIVIKLFHEELKMNFIFHTSIFGYAPCSIMEEGVYIFIFFKEKERCNYPLFITTITKISLFQMRFKLRSSPKEYSLFCNIFIVFNLLFHFFHDVSNA